MIMMMMQAVQCCDVGQTDSSVWSRRLLLLLAQRRREALTELVDECDAAKGQKEEVEVSPEAALHSKTDVVQVRSERLKSGLNMGLRRVRRLSQGRSTGNKVISRTCGQANGCLAKTTKTAKAIYLPSIETSSSTRPQDTQQTTTTTSDNSAEQMSCRTSSTCDFGSSLSPRTSLRGNGSVKVDSCDAIPTKSETSGTEIERETKATTTTTTTTENNNRSKRRKHENIATTKPQTQNCFQANKLCHCCQLPLQQRCGASRQEVPAPVCAARAAAPLQATQPSATTSQLVCVAFLLLTLLEFAPVANCVDCFKCSSRNGSNPACEDPFHNLNSTRITSPIVPDPTPNVIYHTPCYAGKKGREGLFPASACIKLTGTFDNTGETLVVRHCALDSGTLTQDTELARMSHCGKFQFEGDLLKGCVLACPEDACNSSASIYQSHRKWLALASSCAALVIYRIISESFSKCLLRKQT